MRSAFFLSVVSIAVLSLFGWVRHEPERTRDEQVQDVPVDEEAYLFVG
jgi:hypothetical protein